MQMFPRCNQENGSQLRWGSYGVRIITLFLVVVVVVIAAMSFGFSRRTSVAHAATTWNQIWSEDFNGPAGAKVNTSNWLYDIGTGWGTGEIETMTNSTNNVYLDGHSHLVIKPLFANGAWTSGRIESQRSDFAAPVGGKLTVEASIQQPNVSGAAAAGYWPAFWMLGSLFRVDHNWPQDGEVDIMEDINGLSSVFGTLHCGVDPGGPCNETSGIGSGQRACVGCQTGFHTYRMEIDRSVSPEQVRWYLDGVKYFTVNANQVDPTTWAHAVDHGFFIIFDLAMGGGFPAAFGGGPTAATRSGVPMVIDNVHVYTANGSGTGCTGTYQASVVSSGSTSALPWFQPCGWTAGYVIVHYIRSGLAQQNVYMTYNSSTSRWEHNVSGMSPGQVLQYSFTYQKSGLQYDTGWTSWTHP